MDWPKKESSRRGIIFGIGGLLSVTPLLNIDTSTATTVTTQTQQTMTRQNQTQTQMAESQTQTKTTQFSPPPGSSPARTFKPDESGTFVFNESGLRVTYYIDSVEIMDSYTRSDGTVDPDGKFVKILLIARNDNEAAIELGDSMFELVTSEGLAFEPDSDAMLDLERTFYTVELDPKIKKIRSVIFLIPDDRLSSSWWLKIGGGNKGKGELLYMKVPELPEIATSTTATGN